VAGIDGWTGPVWSVRFTPDGKKLIMTGGLYNSRGEGRVWEVATKKATIVDWPSQHRHSLIAAAISPDSEVLVTDCNRSITVWDLRGNQSLFDSKQTLKNYVRVLAFSPDGKTLAAGIGGGWGHSESPGGVVFWDAPGFKERPSGILLPGDTILSLAFSPDGKLLAGGGYDGCLRLWSTATQKEVARLFTNATSTRVAFSPDGKTVVTTGEANTIEMWNTPQAE
jgi:WD40 repeat protein